MSAYMHNVLLRLRRLPLISAAFIEGRAIGGGAELATACDIRLCTERVSIGNYCKTHSSYNRILIFQ